MMWYEHLMGICALLTCFMFIPMGLICAAVCMISGDLRIENGS